MTSNCFCFAIFKLNVLKVVVIQSN